MITASRIGKKKEGGEKKKKGLYAPACSRLPPHDLWCAGHALVSSPIAGREGREKEKKKKKERKPTEDSLLRGIDGACGLHAVEHVHSKKEEERKKKKKDRRACLHLTFKKFLLPYYILAPYH